MRIVLKDRSKWHLWFAWCPVVTEDGAWTWLEYVERRLMEVGSDCDYIYRGTLR